MNHSPELLFIAKLLSSADNTVIDYADRVPPADISTPSLATAYKTLIRCATTGEPAFATLAHQDQGLAITLMELEVPVGVTLPDLAEMIRRKSKIQSIRESITAIESIVERDPEGGLP